MYDTGKIILGIFIFLAVFSVPFWYNSVVTGDADYVPEPQTADKAEEAGQCVENVEYMKAKHMDLLMTWRNDAVRGADKDYVSKEYGGEPFRKSLTGTCLEQCHDNKAEFCDQCHSYVNVKPGCWDCHNIVDNSAGGE